MTCSCVGKLYLDRGRIEVDEVHYCPLHAAAPLLLAALKGMVDRFAFAGHLYSTEDVEAVSKAQDAIRTAEVRA